MSAFTNVTFLKRSQCIWIQLNFQRLWLLLTTRMLRTHPLVGHADDPGVAADHQEDEAEQRHVPSAKHKHKQVVRKPQMSNVIKKSFP